MEIQCGDQFQSGNYGPLLVYQKADLADRFRIVGLVVVSGRWVGTKVGIPEYELGTRFPRVDP
jgi:hypothetical protein